MSLRGKGMLELPAQVLAVLKCRLSVDLPVAHLANEANTLADALSRLEAPAANRKAFPPALSHAHRAWPSEMSYYWRLVEPPASRR